MTQPAQIAKPKRASMTPNDIPVYTAALIARATDQGDMK